MSAILGHYTRTGVKILSKLFPSISQHLSCESLKYFDRTFILASDNVNFRVETEPQCSLTIRQIIKRAVSIILNSPIRKFTSSNVLAFGYHKSIPDGEIQNLFPNHLHNNFLTEPWTELHKLIGDDLMILLLTECSIFITLLGSNNLLQISGKPLSEESVKVPSFSATSSHVPVYISRSKIVYGQPVCSRNLKIIGLPFKHSLNSKSMNKTVLAQKMFNVNCKKNWQFKRLESLADEFLKGHLKCSYAPIYNYYTTSEGQLLQYQVFGFIISVLKRVLPNDFIKNRAFMKEIREKLWIFLKISRFEKMSVNELIHGLKIKKVLPIFDPKATDKKTIPQSEHDKSKGLMKSFMQFLFENFIVDLLRSNFYITEASGSRSRLVYYRHDTWTRLTGPVLETFQESMFQPITTDSTMLKSLSKARCRLVPKDNGKFRPIMAFRKPPSTEEGNRLRASFDILKYFYEKDSGLSVTGFTGLQSKLLEYKTVSKSAGPFYLAKLDISSCFDSIPHEKLFALLASLLNKKEFSVRRVDQIQLDLINNRPVKRINRIAREANYNDFDNLNLNFASVTVDRVSGKFHSGEDIFRIIHDHLSNNIVQINHLLYRQKKGIPQGSFLSTLLCSLFYSQFDKDTGLIDFPQDDLVMRYIDDFLIISPSRDRLERFVEYLQAGFPEFGIKINSEKTRFGSGSELFTWCGLRIHPQTLDISPDYSNFENTNIIDSITSRERNVKVGQALLRQLHYFLRPKLKKLYHQKNSLNTVVFNLIQSFAMVSIKLHAYLRDLPHKMRKEFLTKCVQNVIRYCCKLVRLKKYPELIKSLAWNCFYQILKRKGTIYNANGFLSVLKTKKDDFPLPTAYETLLKESIEPFFKKIKY